MPLSLVAPFVAAVLVAFQAEPQQAPKPSPSPTPTPTLITLTGCVSRTAATGQYTFVASDGVQQYRLSGKAINKYAGRRVELVGGSGAKRLSIRGGLRPSPNVAGRASSMDPAQAAIASRPGGGATAEVANLPELRVSQVREIEGACR